MKARIKFSKTGSMRFIGHLDVMRYFQKAMRRAEINVSYSKGFSPHQLISFTSPLGTGLSSSAEYLDITLEETDTPQVMADKINAVMNDEIRVEGFTYIKDTAKPSMAALAACDYLIALKPGKDNRLSDKEFTRQQIKSFLLQDKIEATKKTKKSEKTIDIKPGIYYMAESPGKFKDFTGRGFPEYASFCDITGDKPVLFLRLVSGSATNIKPALVMENFCVHAGIIYNEFDYQIHRLEMYAMENGELVPMMEYEKI